MHYETNSFRRWLLLVCIVLLFITGCTNSIPSSSSADKSKHDGPPRVNTPAVLVPEASGTTVYGSDLVTIDASHTSDGYIMVLYNGSNEKVKLLIKTPDSTEYTYLVTSYGQYAVYPLPGGSGSYTITLYEAVSVADNLYAVCFSQDLDVAIANEFSPFLYPNCYVNFTPESEAVKKGESLAADCYSDLDVITNIFNFVIKNISYDEKKAKDVSYGYSPNVDETLATKKGICFDYAALMSAMLRSQKIPSKLEVGYAGDAYHAWISCYVDEIGWIDNIIQFDGKNWTLMDPTFAASSGGKKSLVGDGINYQVKYNY